MPLNFRHSRFASSNTLKQDLTSSLTGRMPVFVNKVLLEHRYVRYLLSMLLSVIMAESRSCHRNHMVYRVKNIYYLALHTHKNVPTLALRDQILHKNGIE